jgi:hypothetical protein
MTKESDVQRSAAGGEGSIARTCSAGPRLFVFVRGRTADLQDRFGAKPLLCQRSEGLTREREFEVKLKTSIVRRMQ